MKINLFILIFLWGIRSAFAQLDSHEIIRRAIDSAKAVESAAFKIENTERFNGQMRTGSQEVRYRQQPFQLSMTFLYPDPGATIMYDAAVNVDKMMYDPEGFPYMKMELDPLGALARNNNQHTIYEIGFDHIGRLLELIYENSDETTLLSDNETQNLVQISIKSRRRGLDRYIVGKGECTRSIAQQLKVSEYKLVELNESVKFFGDLKEGMELIVPEYYALEAIFDIDKRNYLPVKLSLSDELGLLAAYSISDVELGVEVMQPNVKKKSRVRTGDQ